MTYKFTMPPQTLIGENALAEAREIFLSLGRRALIVTGKHVLAAESSGSLRSCWTAGGFPGSCTVKSYQSPLIR